MKLQLSLIAVAILTVFSVNAGELDGASFCRSILSDGMFGQPKGVRQHCISFRDGKLVDGANTFFGNPPSSSTYTVANNTIYVQIADKLVPAYRIEADTIVSMESSTVPGTVLKRK